MDSQIGSPVDLADVTDSFVLTDGTLPAQQYKNFWKLVGDRDNIAACYVASLLARLLAIDEKQDKMAPTAELIENIKANPSGIVIAPGKGDKKKSSAKKPKADSKATEPVDSFPTSIESMDTTELRQHLLTTIYFLLLHYRFNAKHGILSVIQERWMSVHGHKTRAGDYLDEIYKMMDNTYLSRNDAIISLVELCSNIESHSGAFAAWKTHYGIPPAVKSGISADYEEPETVDQTVANGDLNQTSVACYCLAKDSTPALAVSYIRTCINKGERIDLIFDTLLLFLKHPLITPGRLLSLLHMLKVFVCEYPCLEHAVIKQAIELVKPYYLWPMPYGAVASKVLDILNQELKAPGAALRLRFSKELPELGLGSDAAAKPTGRERVVHLMLNVKSRYGRTFQELIRASSQESAAIEQMRYSILSNLFQVAVGKSDRDLGLMFLKGDDLAIAFSQAIRVMKEAEVMSNADICISYIRTQLTALYQDIQSSASTRRRTLCAHGGGSNIPKLPQLKLQVMSVKDESDPVVDLANLRTSASGLVYPTTTSLNMLYEALGPYVSAYAETGQKETVRIGLAGGDGSLHNLVMGYVALANLDPKILSSVTVQFYLMPLGTTNNMAVYMSAYDGWYRRHVMSFVTQCVMRTFPCIAAAGKTNAKIENVLKGRSDSTYALKTYDVAAPAEVAEDEEHEAEENLSSFNLLASFATAPRIPPPSPAVLLRNELENYYREAEHRLDVKLYQAVCTDKEGKTVVLPFCQRFELGLGAAVQQYRAEKQLLASTTCSEVAAAKAFKFASFDLKLKLTEVDLLGQPKPMLDLDSRSYFRLVFINVPRIGDAGACPNPCENYLELFVMETDSRKKYKHGKVDEGRVYHVSCADAELVASDKKGEQDASVMVCLEGSEVYGPYTKIRIESSLHPITKEQLTLPLMTFFPMAI